jgi:ATP synthase mitochondrial F1 complex assembly factor 1
MRKFNFKRYFSFNYPCPRKLKDVTKLALLEREHSNRVKEIWKQHYSDNLTSFSNTLQAIEFETLMQKY